MFTPITRFFVCIFWNAVRNHRISMFTPITRFLVCICRLCASTPVNGHKLSVAVYDTGPLTLNSLHYYYQDYAFQSYRPRTIEAIQNKKGCNPVWAQLVQLYEPSQQWQQLVRSYRSSWAKLEAVELRSSLERANERAGPRIRFLVAGRLGNHEFLGLSTVHKPQWMGLLV